MKLASEPGGVVCHLDACAVKVGDGRDEAEAEAVARALPAALEAIKPAEDVLAFLNRNSRAAIGNRKNGSIGVARDGDRNRSVSFAAVLDRIVDKIGDGVEQQIPIADHLRSITGSEPQRYAVLLRRGIEQLQDLSSNFGQIQISKPGRPVARLYLGDPQK
jgi:hypothetical protein